MKQKGSVGKTSAHPVEASTSDGHETGATTSQGSSNGAITPAARQRIATRALVTRAEASEKRNCDSAALKSAPSFCSCDNIQGSSNIMEARTRAQTKALQEKSNTKDKPEAQEHQGTSPAMKQKGSVGKTSAHAIEASTSDGHETGAATSQGSSNGEITPAARQRIATRASVTRAEASGKRNCDSAALKSAPSFRSCDNIQGSSNIMEARTRAQTKALQEKSNAKDKPEAQASSVGGARLARNRTRAGESVPQAALHDDRDVHEDAAVNLSTDSEPAVREKTKKKMYSKEKSRLAVEGETLRGSLESLPTTSGAIYDQILPAEAAPKGARRRAAATKSPTTAAKVEMVPGGSKRNSSNVSKQQREARQVRKTSAASSKLDGVPPEKHRRTARKPNKALPSSTGNGKASKRRHRKGKDVAEPETITAKRGTKKWKSQVRSLLKTSMRATADDVFAKEHGVQQTKKPSILDVLLESDFSDEDSEASGLFTPGFRSPQWSPTRSSLADTRSSLPSTDVYEADKNMYRMERQTKEKAASVLTSPLIPPKREIKQEAFLEELRRVERETLDLEERNNYQESDTEPDYFSDESSLHEDPM